MKPLQGFRILSLALNVPGPVAISRLGDLGAAIVKIEPPAGDALAQASPAWYASLHDGLDVHRIDLKTAGGSAYLASALTESDLLLTSQRPAALGRLGLAWPTLAESYPQLSQVAIIGYPAPDENKPGHDLTYQAELGLVEPPQLPRTLLADLTGGEWAVSSALALLLAGERSRSSGRRVAAAERYAEVSLAAAAAACARPLHYGLTGSGGVLGGRFPGYNLYQTLEGWVAVAALEPHFLARLVEALGLADVSKEALAEAFLRRPAADWELWAAERDIPLVAVRGP
jgi:crotonobetainyl-CoA:carnitine CoA-transferase CaiB-like acyl-CoA transferase